MRKQTCSFPFSLLLYALLIYPALSQSSEITGPKKLVALISGQAIYEDELLPLIQAQMRQLQNQEYELKSRALEGLVNQRIVEAEAKKKGVPVEKLLAGEIDSKAAEPTDAEVEAYYLGQKDRLNRPLEEVKAQLRQTLKQAKLQQARESYFARLREKAEVAILLSPPRAPVAADPTRLRGGANAPVTIVEFSDFQCPYCQRVQPALKEVLAKYDGRVNLSFRDFPLRQIHPQAQMAAEAARCAGEQGKFWEYHDLLYGNPSKLDAAGLAESGGKLGLDAAKFKACLDSGKYKPQVEEDLQAGSKVGVNGTPAFFINGIFLSGAQPASAFEKTIEAELALLKQSRDRR